MDASRLRKRALPKTTSMTRNRLVGGKGTVPAVARATRLLDALAHAKEPTPLSELTRQLNLPKSTVHGLCTTLVQAGLVTRYENGTYHLGLHIMDLAHAFVSRTDLTVQFAKLWDSLALLPEETIILSVLDGADVVYIACRNGSRPLGVSFRIGMRLPASCTASGKALLSSLSPERVGELMGTAGLRPLTRKSVAGLEALQRQLALARKRGYSVDDEETRDGMICFGAPVFDSSRDEAVAGVGVSLLKATVDQSQRLLAAQAVKQMAEALSKRMGASMISHPGP